MRETDHYTSKTKAIRRAAMLAEPIFRDNRWQWVSVGVPDRYDIADMYRDLDRRIDDKVTEKMPHVVTSGRLTVIGMKDGQREYLVELGELFPRSAR